MEFEKMLKALGEPTRYRIFLALLERRHCVRSLAREIGISESAISQHLKVMRTADLIYGEQYGYHTHYFPKQEALDFLAGQFDILREKSHVLDRDTTACRCEYRKEGK